MSPRDSQIGDIAVREGLVSRNELQAALEASTIGEGRPLEEIMLEMNLITGTQLDRIRNIHVRESGEDQPVLKPDSKVAPPAPTTAAEIFGKVVMARGFASQSQVDESIEEQRRLAGEGRTMRLGQIMVKRRFITSEQFLEILRVQERYIVVCGTCSTKHFASDSGTLACRSCGDELPKTDAWDQMPTRQGTEGNGSSADAETAAPTPVIPPDPLKVSSAIQTIKVPPKPTSQTSRIEDGILGKYQIQNEIGRGSLGIVYRALDEPLNRVVALKALRSSSAADPKWVQHFIREAKTSARLNHESIVTIHEVGNVGDTSYFTMEFIEGDTFENLLEESRMKRDDALRVLERVARALDYAHGEGVYHRNLKPSNVLIDTQNRPHLTDFGLGKGELLTEPLSEDPADVGAPHYLAPEQIRGEKTSVDARTDVYSLGIILYRILTGALPYSGGDRADVYRKILEAEPRRPRQVDPGVEAELETICRRAMERERSLRYSSVREFAEDLGRFLAGRPIETKPVSVLQRLRRRARRSKMLVPTAVLLLAGLAFGGYWLKGYLEEQSRIKAEEAARARRDKATQKFAPAEEAYEQIVAPDLSKDKAKTHLASINTAIDDALQEDDSFAEAHAMRARIAEMQGDLDGALSAWDEAVKHDPKKYMADRATIRLVRFGLLTGSPVRLSGHFGQTAAPAQAEPKWAVAERGAMKADFEAVLEDKNINRGLRLCSEGAISLAEGKFDEAVSRATRVDSRDSRYATALRIRALASFRQAKFRRCYQDFLTLRKDLPRIPGNEPAGEFGFYTRGELEWALKNATGKEAAVYRGLVHEALGDRKRAQDEYSRRPDDADALSKRAFLLLAEKKNQKAMIDAKAACRKDPNLMDAILARAAVNTEDKKYLQAKTDLDRVLRNRREDVGGNYLRGRCRLALDERDSALGDARRAVDVLPIFYPAYSLRAQVHISLRNFLGAEDDAKKARKLKNDYVPAIVTLADLMAARDNIEAAIRLMTEAIKLEPKNPDLFWKRGHFKIRRRAPHAALDDFKLALQHDPEHVDSLVWHALALYSTGDAPGAMRELNEFVDDNPNHWAGYRWRGRLWAFSQQWRQAITDLQAAIERHAPNAREIQREITTCRIQLQNQQRPANNTWQAHFNEAMKHIRAVIENDDGKSRKDHYPKALAEYKKGIALIPNPPPAEGTNERITLAVGIYNVACIYAVQARWETKEKAKRDELMDEAFKWLSVCLQLGFADQKCSDGHANGREHAMNDADFSAIKEDARFKRLIHREE